MHPLKYKLLKAWGKWGLKAEFRKIDVYGAENLLLDKPLILAPNHQNAFVDAMLPITQVDKQGYFLTRADLFQRPWLARLLSALNLIAIYRQRDKVNPLTKNEAVFQKCREILAEGHAVLLFPEANQEMTYALRPLKKGCARIALSAVDELGLDVQVVPVGVHFHDYARWRSVVQVQFGEAIAVRDYLAAYRISPRQCIRQFTLDLQSRLEAEMLHIAPAAHYEKIDALVAQEAAKTLATKSQWTDREAFLAEQKVARQLATLSQPELDALAPHSSQKSHKTKRLSGTPEKPSIFRLILFFIPFILGFIIHFLPLVLTDILVHKLIPSPKFKTSVRIVMRMIWVSIFYFIYTLLGFVFLPLPIALVIPFALPLIGHLSLRFLDEVGHFRRSARHSVEFPLSAPVSVP